MRGGSSRTRTSNIAKRRLPPPSEAQKLLRRVIEDHPTTPWALLAERELKDPLGFKWVETYVQPRPRGNDNAAAQRKNKPANMAKPPEMPKL